MPPMLASQRTAALVSDCGRVALSTDIHLPVGALAHEATQHEKRRVPGDAVPTATARMRNAPISSVLSPG